VPTCTIITTTSTDSVGRIHDRMPMTIAPDHWAEWLDPRNHDVDQLPALMAPAGRRQPRHVRRFEGREQREE
jgi:putative SOS response-associated peptidase YedK